MRQKESRVDEIVWPVIQLLLLDVQRAKTHSKACLREALASDFDDALIEVDAKNSPVGPTKQKSRDVISPLPQPTSRHFEPEPRPASRRKGSVVGHVALANTLSLSAPCWPPWMI